MSIKNYIAKCGANDDENFLLNELVAKLKGWIDKSRELLIIMIPDI